MVLEYIPREYTDLARAWGIRAEYGNLIAFTASLIFISAIVWLGVILSFGRLIRENEFGKKALTVISIAIGFITAYGAAAPIVFILSNLIYTIAMIGAIFVLVAIGKALWAGVPAAGAAIAEAKKLEYLQKAEMERTRRAYEEQLHLRLTAAKRIVQDLDVALDAAIRALEEVYDNLNKSELKDKNPKYYEILLGQISNVLNLAKNAKDKGDATSKFSALQQIQMELELASAEINEMLGDKGKVILKQIERIIEGIKRGLFRADKDLEELVKLYSQKQK